ncbi:hypothetical protein C8Q79DRAFT_137789 [Trametes meyenii]|nr:hypothetical protein C8Q79DRAFT_137789 [Trametes meyenii]
MPTPLRARALAGQRLSPAARHLRHSLHLPFECLVHDPAWPAWCARFWRTSRQARRGILGRAHQAISSSLIDRSHQAQTPIWHRSGSM